MNDTVKPCKKNVFPRTMLTGDILRKPKKSNLQYLKRNGGAYHEFILHLWEFYASRTQDAEVTKSLEIMQFYTL